VERVPSALPIIFLDVFIDVLPGVLLGVFLGVFLGVLAGGAVLISAAAESLVISKDLS